MKSFKLLETLQSGQKLEVTVWRNEKDEEGLTFPSQIEAFQLDTLTIRIPSDLVSELSEGLQPDIIVGVLNMSTEKPIIFYPRVKTFQSGFPALCHLEVSEITPSEIAERRRHVRITVEIPFQVFPVQTGQKSVEALGINLSGSGVRFVSKQLFQAHEEVRIEIPCNLGQQSSAGNTKDVILLNLKAKVVFSQVNSYCTGPHDPFVTGLFFYDLSQQEEDLLMKEAFRWEMGVKRNQLKPNQ